MYLPDHFAEHRLAEIHRIVEAHPLGMLVAMTPGGLDANHLPFELDADAGRHGVLHAHVARNNPVWQDVKSGDDVLVVFRAEDAYISPNWYPSKHETHRQVPTWNYEVVHAHGVLTVRDDEQFVRGLVARLTRRHEANEPKPWKMGDSEREFIDGMLRNIVGIEIAVTSLVGKSKLSQNKETRDRIGAADALDARGKGELARVMGRAGD